MSEEVVRSALRALRGHGNQPEMSILIMQICAWAKLSKTAKIPASISFDRAVTEPSPQTCMQLCFKELQQEQTPMMAQAFQVSDKTTEKPGAIDEAISIIWSAVKAEKIDYSVVVERALALTADRSSFYVQSYLAQLVIQLSGVNGADTVYCPFESSYSIASAAADISEKVFTEASHQSQIPFLINLLEDKNIEAVFSDPILSPSWTDGDKLRLFDITIAFPPLGRRIDPKKLDDWYGRFPYRSAFGEVYAIQHAMTQTRNKVIVCVSNGVLFRSSQMERQYRRHLIEEGRLETIISLPKDIFHPSASVACSLLVINCQGNASDVLFIDATRMRKHQTLDFSSTGRLAKTVFDCPQIMELVEARYNSNKSAVVNTHELAENDFNLVADRYITSDRQRELEAKLKEHQLTTLSEVAELIRPQALRKQKDAKGDIFFEVWPSDAPDGGYLQQPRRQIILSESQLNKAWRQEITASDLLLSTKGTVGSVALTSPDMKDHWLPSQSQLIIRLKPDSKIDPRALCMYMRSEVFQALLTGYATGATVQMVQMSDLRKLPIPIMSPELQQQLIDAFEEQASAIEEIKALERKSAEIKKRHWGLTRENDEDD